MFDSDRFKYISVNLIHYQAKPQIGSCVVKIKLHSHQCTSVLHACSESTQHPDLIPMQKSILLFGHSFMKNLKQVPELLK